MYYEFPASVKGVLFPTVVSAPSLKTATGIAMRSVKRQWAWSRETAGSIRTDEIDLGVENVITWNG